MAERDYHSSLRAVRYPVLLVEGERGNTSPGQLGQLAVELANTRHLRVPNSGHLAHADVPQAFRGAVEAFLVEVG